MPATATAYVSLLLVVESLAKNLFSLTATDTMVFAGTGTEAGADEDYFHTIKRRTAEADREERTESRALKKLDVKIGAMSKTMKSFASQPPTSAKKKVVFF